MGNYKDTHKVVIPHYDVPVGVQMKLETREGILTYQKQEDGDWEVVNFEGAKA